MIGTLITRWTLYTVLLYGGGWCNEEHLRTCATVVGCTAPACPLEPVTGYVPRELEALGSGSPSRQHEPQATLSGALGDFESSNRNNEATQGCGPWQFSTYRPRKRGRGTPQTTRSLLRPADH